MSGSILTNFKGRQVK